MAARATTRSPPSRSRTRTVIGVGVGVGVGKGAGIPEYGHVIALATAMQESTLINVASHTSNPGLTDISGWQNLTVTQAAQRVQRSAYPDAYAKWEALAREIVAKQGPSTGPIG